MGFLSTLHFEHDVKIYVIDVLRTGWYLRSTQLNLYSNARWLYQFSYNLITISSMFFIKLSLHKYIGNVLTTYCTWSLNPAGWLDLAVDCLISIFVFAKPLNFKFRSTHRKKETIKYILILAHHTYGLWSPGAKAFGSTDYYPRSVWCTWESIIDNGKIYKSAFSIVKEMISKLNS